MTDAITERFHSKWTPEPNTGCHLWMGGVNSDGYGWMWVNGKNKAAHRLSYELQHGEIKNGLCVLHQCDTPTCVNPKHLRLGTPKDNSVDADKKGRLKVRGELHGRAKLTNEMVRAIRASSERTIVLAKRYGTSLCNLQKIKNRTAWVNA